MRKLIDKLASWAGYVPRVNMDNAMLTMTKIINQRDTRIEKMTHETAKLEYTLNGQIQNLQSINKLQNQHAHALSDSRFLVLKRDPETNQISIDKITESQISDNLDMSDCYVDARIIGYLYLDDDGKLYDVRAEKPAPISPAAIDEFYQENPTTIFSQAGNLIANGKAVGCVRYTDH